MPHLKVGLRVLLYLCLMMSCTISIVNLRIPIMTDTISYVMYVIAFLSLMVGPYYLIKDIFYLNKIVRGWIQNNSYTNMVANDYRLRRLLFMVPGMFGNILFAVFNAITGYVSKSAWFGSIAAYYILLSIMRVGIVVNARRVTKIENQGERLRKETKIYKRNSRLFILLSIVLAGMTVLLRHSQGVINYAEFVIYGVAAYTFYRIVNSTIHLIKRREQSTPLVDILNKIGYVDAFVSLLTLQIAMLTLFGSEDNAYFNIVMNCITSGAVSILILAMGIHGILKRKKC